jgi:hypothetical protein
MVVTSIGRTAFPNRQARGALNAKSQRRPIAKTLSDRQADEYYRARSEDDQQDPFANLSDGLAKVKERRSTTNFPMAGAIESELQRGSRGSVRGRAHRRCNPALIAATSFAAAIGYWWFDRRMRGKRAVRVSGPAQRFRLGDLLRFGSAYGYLLEPPPGINAG